jgi:hypothetical protein
VSGSGDRPDTGCQPSGADHPTHPGTGAITGIIDIPV